MYDVDFQRSIMKLYFENIQFSSSFGSLIREEYFETQPMKILLRLATKYIYLYERGLDIKDLTALIDDYVRSHQYGIDTFQMLKDEASIIYRMHIKNEQFLIDQFIKFCRRQELKLALSKAINIIEKDEDEYELILKLIDGAVSIGAGANLGYQYEDLLNFPAIYKNYYAKSKLVSTGFHKYDEALMGGLASGEVHCIQACPKSGKSTMMANIGSNALLNGTPVFHVTLELKAVDVLAKYAVRLSGLSYADLLNVDSPHYVERIQKYAQFKPKLFVNYWTEGSVNTFTIRSWISRIRAEKNVNPGIIIIDYDDCLNPVKGPKEDMYNDAGEIYSDLISLADYFKCPCITVAQPRREAWDKVKNGDIIQSYDLAHSAKKVFKCFSLSSINFAESSNQGILYIDLVRRGESSVRIPIYRDFNHAYISEQNFNAA